MADNRVRIRAELEDGVSKGLGRIRGEFDKVAQSPGARTFLQGVGLGVGQAAWNAVGAVASKVTGFLGDSARAFIDDERSVRQLTASLQANVPGWDGNTAAIERVLQARMALGFSDDEQRDSLKLLAAATHDATAALNLQRTAMDLARLKGIDLATASDALIRVEGGQYRALKGLGIQLRDGATAQEALAAVQAVANGQAEAYADTLAGRLEVAQVRAGEASEKFGKQVSRVIVPLQELGADVLGMVADGFDRLTAEMDDDARIIAWYRAQGIEPTIAQIEALRAKTVDLVDRQHELGGSAIGAAAALAGAAAATGRLTDRTRTAATPTGSLRDLLRDLGYKADDADQAIGDLASTISDDLFGDAINAGRLAELKAEHAELVKQRDGAKEGSREYAILTGKIAENEAALFDLHFEMAQADGPAAVLAFLDREEAKLGDADQAARDHLATLRKLYALLLRFDDLGTIDFGRYAGKIIPGFAKGGDYPADAPMIVGERGPEIMVPNSAGTVIPNVAWQPSSRTATMQPAIVVLQLDGREVARVVDDRLYLALAGATGARR